MPRNSSGTYTLPESAFLPGTTISSTAVNNDFSDIATALTQSIATTGVSVITGSLKGATGSAAAPSYSFASDLDTGFYLAGTNQIGIATGGTLRGTFNSDGSFSWTGAFTVGTITITTANITTANVSGRVLLADGTQAAPSLAFTNDGATDTGWYHPSDGVIVCVANNIEVGRTNVSGDYTFAHNMFVGGNTYSSAGYVDFTEIAAPGSPAANVDRLYSRDDGSGRSRMYYKDNGGVEIPLTGMWEQIGETVVGGAVLNIDFSLTKNYAELLFVGSSFSCVTGGPAQRQYEIQISDDGGSSFVTGLSGFITRLQSAGTGTNTTSTITAFSEISLSNVTNDVTFQCHINRCDRTVAKQWTGIGGSQASGSNSLATGVTNSAGAINFVRGHFSNSDNSDSGRLTVYGRVA